MDLTALHTIQALAHSVAVRKLRPNEVVFQGGDAGDTIFAVLTGEIRLLWPAGGEERFLPGQVFGVGALVSPDHSRHASAQAVCSSEVLEMNREEFLFAVQETPMFALEVMASLERRLRSSQG